MADIGNTPTSISCYIEKNRDENVTIILGNLFKRNTGPNFAFIFWLLGNPALNNNEALVMSAPLVLHCFMFRIKKESPITPLI